MLSVKLKITHSFIKRISVRNACITEFRIATYFTWRRMNPSI